VQYTVSELINTRRPGVVDAQMLVQSVCSDMQSASNAARGNAPTPRSGDKTPTHSPSSPQAPGFGTEADAKADRLARGRRNTNDLTVELQQRALQRAEESGAKPIKDPKSTVRSTGPRVVEAPCKTVATEMDLLAWPRTVRRESLLDDLRMQASDIEIDSDDDDDDAVATNAARLRLGNARPSSDTASLQASSRIPAVSAFG